MSQPSQGAPIAEKTQWTPLVPGGANFITDKLVEEGPSRFALRPTSGLKAVGMVFFPS